MSTRALTIGAACLVGAALVTRVAAEPSGPVVAIEKAHIAADRESNHAHAEDAEAAQLGADTHAPTADESARNDADASRGGAAAAQHANNAAPAANDVPNTAAVPGGDGTRPAGGPADASARHDGAPGNPGFATAATMNYDPAQHRDPFRAPSLTTSVVKDDSPKTPLEKYELGQLKLVGVVTQGGGGSRAMVEDSAGLGYIVTTGTPIGSSGGVVTRIEPRRVLIEESVTNFYGEKEPKQVVMELPKEERSP